MSEDGVELGRDQCRDPGISGTRSQDDCRDQLRVRLCSRDYDRIHSSAALAPGPSGPRCGAVVPVMGHWLGHGRSSTESALRGFIGDCAAICRTTLLARIGYSRTALESQAPYVRGEGEGRCRLPRGYRPFSSGALDGTGQVVGSVAP